MKMVKYLSRSSKHGGTSKSKSMSLCLRVFTVDIVVMWSAALDSSSILYNITSITYNTILISTLF